MIRLFDTARQEVRELTLRDEGHASIYVCGPTVYDVPHLGHGRFTLVWDVLRRWLHFRGLEVRFVSNITDVDDKIIQRAEREGVPESDVATRFEDVWWTAMTQLGVLRPSVAPRATQWISPMVELIEELLRREVAYALVDGIYFDVSRVPDYGLLALQPLDSLRAGARVDARRDKRSALDFALWKFAKPGEPRWPASFGEGRPGWHTECVVMSLGLLGEGFDLHCGGFDLTFPHHENERAQAEALHKPFARHWAHNGFVMSGGEKMSKSLGNFTSLSDLLDRTDARAYRLLVVRSHYRSPLEVSVETVADAERALGRLDALARRFSLPRLAGESLVDPVSEWSEELATFVTETTALLDDDLNTPAAVAKLFEGVSRANTLADQGDDGAREWALMVNTLFGALGLSLHGDADSLDEDVVELVSQRDAARARRDWVEADRLRKELEGRGWIVEDSSQGTRVRRG
ncbi:MAG: cysteine--tRNA ligase [Acidimicrobiaceae bacterium]|nr:cysteine--tRNA ligase [Acidimicrobiaceae bacterium]